MKIVNLILIAIFAMSCSKDSSQDDTYSTYYPSNYSSLEAELEKTDFYCKDEASCPANVGLVYINHNGSEYSPQVGRCTGFLVEDDIVATNSHCLPDRLKIAQGDCSNQMAIRFLVDGEKYIFGCKEIIEYSELTLSGSDFSFFRIESSGIKPLQILQEGIKDNQPIEVARVTPMTHSLGGVLSIDRCRVVLGSLLNLKATNSWSETGLAMDCEAIPGNSGSPVLNVEGKVIGILQSKMKDQYLANLENSFNKFGLKLPRRIKPHFIFTNFSCANSKKYLENNPKCESASGFSFSDCLNLDAEENNIRADRLIDIWRGELPDIFLYNFVTKLKDGSISAEPLCVKSEQQTTGYSTYVEKKGVIGFRKEKIELTYPRDFKMGARFSTDQDLRLSPELDFVEEYKSKYQISLTNKSSIWYGTTNSTFNSSRLGIDLSSLKINLKIPNCTDQEIKDGNKSYVRMMDNQILKEQDYLEIEKQKKAKKVCEK